MFWGLLTAARVLMIHIAEYVYRILYYTSVHYMMLQRNIASIVVATVVRCVCSQCDGGIQVL